MPTSPKVLQPLLQTIGYSLEATIGSNYRGPREIDLAELPSTLAVKIKDQVQMLPKCNH